MCNSYLEQRRAHAAHVRAPATTMLMLRSLALLALATLATLAPAVSARSCSRQPPPPPSQMTFLGSNPTSSGGLGAVSGDYTQSYIPSTAGVNANTIFSDSPPTPQQLQRVLSQAAWTTSRAGTLKDLFVSIIYISRDNSTAIPGNVGTISITVQTAAPESSSYSTTTLSVSAPLHLSPTSGSDATRPNVLLALSDPLHYASLAAGTRVVALINLAWTSAQAIDQEVDWEFWISGGYLFE